MRCDFGKLDGKSLATIWTHGGVAHSKASVEFNWACLNE